MRYAFTAIFALQIVFSPVCMTQIHAQQASSDTVMSMAGHDHAAHHGTSQQKPCDQDGDCFSRSSLQSALSPDQQLPLFAAAALPVAPLSLTTLAASTAPLAPPEDPPPVALRTETIVLLQ